MSCETKKRGITLRVYLPILCAIVVLAACGSSNSTMDDDYISMMFSIDGDRIVGSGVVDATTLGRFQQISGSSPETKVLVLQNVEGSADDEANLIFSQFIRDEGFNTVVPSDGLVASGGTDLFLAGLERIIESGACVGVHSWSAGNGVQGSELPAEDPEHLKYLNYYERIGISSDFYWFTLQAAPADDMHWITAAEANQYMMSTAIALDLNSDERCEQRLQ